MSSATVALPSSLSENRLSSATIIWIVLGWVGYAVLPWYSADSGVAADLVAGSGLVQGLRGAWWLIPIGRASAGGRTRGLLR